jgi:hypothetical protein
MASTRLASLALRPAAVAVTGLIVLAAVVLPTPSAFGATRVLPPVRLSGASPFPAGCATKAGIKDLSTVQLGSEVEPTLAVDPSDPRTVVAAYQQDRIKTGSSLGIVDSVSRDGGRTFTQRLLPGTSGCQGGIGKGTDPQVSIAKDGTVYTITQVADGYVMSRSHDHGDTSKVLRVTTGNTLINFDDKESLLADPFRPGHLYLAWDDIQGVQPADNFLAGLAETVRFTSTSNGGDTWSGRGTAYQPVAPAYSAGGPVIVERPGGELVVLFGTHRNDDAVNLPAQSDVLMAVRSSNGGKTFTAPTPVATVPPASSDVIDPGTGKCIRTGGDCPGNHLADGLAAAVEPDGTIDAIWQQNKRATSGDIMLSRSSDGGVHWSAPRVAVHSATQVFLPEVAVGPNGTVGISYDAARPYAKGDTAFNADAFLATATDGSKPFTPVRLAGPFDLRKAPESTTEAVGHFLGDYNGLVAFPDGFGVDYAASAPMAQQGASDVFFSRVILNYKPPRHRKRHGRRRK